MRTRGESGRIARVALIAVFVAGIGLPLAGAFLPDAPLVSQMEQRRLVRRPVLEPWPDALAAYPRRFEAFYNDRYGFRDTLLRWHAALKVRVLGISPTPRVVIGKEGWLFLGEPSGLDNYRPPRLFSPAELAAWQQVLEERRDWLAARGSRYLLAIVPAKQTVYPEFLPDAVRRVRQETRLNQLLAHLRAHSSVDVLDLRPALQAAKRKARVYQRTDIHWTDFGAYVAYREIVQRLAGWFPQLAPAPLAGFNLVSETGHGGDLARMMGVQRLYEEEQIRVRPKVPRQARAADPGALRPALLGRNAPRATERDDPALPRAVMFRDSYARPLWPFLSEHFRRIVYVWRVPLEPAAIEQERPDVVIHEFGERTLWLYRPANPRELRAAPGPPQRGASRKARRGRER